MEPVIHTIEPIFSAESETLILGTMPSPKSRAAGFFYAHPQNRFWAAIALAYGAPAPETQSEKTAFLLERKLALWDVLARCDIIGASDASIRNPVANDIAALLKQTRIERVFCTGQTAARLYMQLVYPATNLVCVALPSPSAANARMSLAALAEAYRGAFCV